MARAEFLSYQSRSRDQQDGIERHVFGKQEYVNGAGSIVKVRGTDTTDEEAVVLNISGVGFNLPENSNTEVFLLSSGSDTNQKVAILTIPRDKQRQWAEGAGGVQHPTNPNRAIEFNGDECWLKDGEFKLGDNKEVTISISGGVATISVSKFVVNADVEFNGSSVKHNGVEIGETHEHINVTPGGGNSGPPAP